MYPTTTRPDLYRHLAIDPAQPVEQWRRHLPARGACYLLCDAERRPLLLSTVGGMRAAVERRLAQNSFTPSRRRIDYRLVVRHIYWRPTFSRFEADWVYLENVRRLLPEQHRQWLKTRRVCWLSLQAEHKAPYWASLTRPTGPPDLCLGPLPSPAIARYVIQGLEELFDLCRYPHVLADVPHASACPYKEMGKCPAPCDGSIALPDYRRLVEQSAAFLAGQAGPWLAEQNRRMRQAAADLQFEQAAASRRRIEQAQAILEALGQNFRSIEQFRYLSIQPGSGKNKHRLFYVNPTQIHFLGETCPPGLEQQCRWVLEQVARLEQATQSPLDAVACERMTLAGWHLVRRQDDGAIFLPVCDLETDRLEQLLSR